MKKKLLALLSLILCLVLAFSLTSCFGSEEEEEEVDPKVKEAKWDDYRNLNGFDSFTVKMTYDDETYTIKAANGDFFVYASDNSIEGNGEYETLVDFLNEMLPSGNVSESSFAFTNATFDKKTSSYAITCYSNSGSTEYKFNVYFADKVLQKITVSATDIIEGATNKFTFKFSKWNKTSI